MKRLAPLLIYDKSFQLFNVILKESTCPASYIEVDQWFSAQGELATSEGIRGSPN